MSKDHVTAAGLTMDQSERVGDRFEALDSPIARIGLHLIENFGGSGHNEMILQVTLYCNAQFGGKNLSSNGAVAEPHPAAWGGAKPRSGAQGCRLQPRDGPRERPQHAVLLGRRRAGGRQAWASPRGFCRPA